MHGALKAPPLVERTLRGGNIVPVNVRAACHSALTSHIRLHHPGLSCRGWANVHPPRAISQSKSNTPDNTGLLCHKLRQARSLKDIISLKIAGGGFDLSAPLLAVSALEALARVNDMTTIDTSSKISSEMSLALDQVSLILPKHDCCAMITFHELLICGLRMQLTNSTYMQHMHASKSRVVWSACRFDMQPGR